MAPLKRAGCCRSECLLLSFTLDTAADLEHVMCRQLEGSEFAQAYQLLLLFAYGTWSDYKGARLAARVQMPCAHTDCQKAPTSPILKKHCPDIASNCFQLSGMCLCSLFERAACADR